MGLVFKFKTEMQKNKKGTVRSNRMKRLNTFNGGLRCPILTILKMKRRATSHNEHSFRLGVHRGHFGKPSQQCILEN
ncbi:hypothetical protein PilKf_00581 [Pillotina sp. SPG140]|jgi:hypothetical protein